MSELDDLLGGSGPQAQTLDDLLGGDPLSYDTEPVIDKQHPELTRGQRMMIMNIAVNTGGDTARKYLRDKLGFEVEQEGPAHFKIRRPGSYEWYKVDPSGFEIDDLLDIGGDVFKMGAQGLGALGAGTLAAGTGPGALLAASGGAAVGGAASEAILQRLGRLGGLEPSVEGELGAIGFEAAVGAASPLAGKLADKAIIRPLSRAGSFLKNKLYTAPMEGAVMRGAPMRVSAEAKGLFDAMAPEEQASVEFLARGNLRKKLGWSGPQSEPALAATLPGRRIKTLPSVQKQYTPKPGEPRNYGNEAWRKEYSGGPIEDYNLQPFVSTRNVPKGELSRYLEPGTSKGSTAAGWRTVPLEGVLEVTNATGTHRVPQMLLKDRGTRFGAMFSAVGHSLESPARTALNITRARGVRKVAELVGLGTVGAMAGVMPMAYTAGGLYAGGRLFSVIGRYFMNNPQALVTKIFSSSLAVPETIKALVAPIAQAAKAGGTDSARALVFTLMHNPTFRDWAKAGGASVLGIAPPTQE